MSANTDIRIFLCCSNKFDPCFVTADDLNDLPKVGYNFPFLFKKINYFYF